MFVPHWRSSRALATATVALALAGGAAACGDSGDEADDAAQRTDATEASPSAGSTDAGGRRPDEPGDEPRDGAGAGDDGSGPGDGGGASSGPSADGGDDSGAGDSDDDGSSAGGGGLESQVADTVTGMYRDIAEGDAAGVCAVMTRAAREQIAQSVPGGSTDAPAERTCEKSMGRFLDAAAASGLPERTLATTVEDVQVVGRRATVTVTAAGRSGKVKLLREDGDWRFGAEAVGAPQRRG
jgi:hypothetical protein